MEDKKTFLIYTLSGSGLLQTLVQLCWVSRILGTEREWKTKRKVITLCAGCHNVL